MKKDIILAGVGGQGILTIATILGHAALNRGWQLKQAEVHGMSQRGGDVQSHLRLSDKDIHSDYRLYPNNYIAMDELDGTDHTDHYTEDDVRKFKLYIQSQLAKSKISNKDEEFLRERLLTMYANPARNYIEAVRG